MRVFAEDAGLGFHCVYEIPFLYQAGGHRAVEANEHGWRAKGSGEKGLG